MHMFKSLGSALALALSLCVASVAHAADRVIEYTLYATACGYGDAKAKLEADLAYQADAKATHVGRVNSGLDRDGNGWRQHSAMELAVTNPAPSTQSVI